jgi:signal transduction histidine kinase
VVKEEEATGEPSSDYLRELGFSTGLTRPAPQAPTMERTGRPTVLVVEDDLQMNRFISGILAENYDVLSAYDGLEGLNKAIANRPDLILSDIMMPEMSGDQLVPRLRAVPELAETPIILLSAKADEALQIRLLKEGANDYLLKPFSMEEVRAKAANFIGLNLARRALQAELDSREGDVAKLVAETISRKKQLEQALADQRAAEEGLRTLNAELEERIAQRTLALTQANEELELFTSTATHDLRAPLRTIAGMAGILLDEHKEEVSPEALDYLNRMHAGVRRIDLLIQDLFAYSRVGHNQVILQSLPLMNILQVSRDALEEEIQARQAKVTIEPTELSVRGQETLLTQVVINLLSNAIKYVAPPNRPQVRIKAEERGDWVRLLVTDNGVGISEEHQEKVFELFTRLHPARDYPGSGLGLAILAKAVTRMGGRFGVESKPAEGSTFWVELRKGS